MFIDALVDASTLMFEFVKTQIIHSSVYFFILWPLIHKFATIRPGIAMCLCWLVLLRLLVPVDIASPISLFSLFGDRVGELSHEWSEHFSGNPEVLPSRTLNESDFIPGYLLLIISCFWLCYSTFLACEYFSYRRKIKIFISASKPLADIQLLEAVSVWKARFGIKREIRVVVSDELDFPFTVGTLAPTIVIPETLITNAKRNSFSDEFEIVTAHELGHVKRLDDLTILLLLFFKCVFFFYPVIWLCGKYIHECREKLCDREVLCQQTIKATAYAHTLVNIASRSNHAAYIASGPVARISETELLTKRITYLKQRNSSKRTSPMKSIITLITTCCLLFPIASHTNSNSGTHEFVSPVETGWISSAYGNRIFPVGPDKGKMKFHRGIDIAGKRGTPILAISDSVVIEAVSEEENVKNPALGTYVVLQHTNNYISKYTHLDELFVSEGETVRPGTKIGSMGNTGQATGSHLHFELLLDSVTIDPATMINFSNLKSAENK